MVFMDKQKRYRGDSGFTIMELLGVVALMLIISAMATPAFYYWTPTVQLSSGARQVAEDLSLARMKAIAENKSYRLNFPTTSTYYLQKDDGGFANESGPFSLPDGVTADSTGATSVFQPRGTADAADTITLTNSDGATEVVELTIVGRIGIQ
jgi:Tfp pilus assembly protein FimT